MADGVSRFIPSIGLPDGRDVGFRAWIPLI
jgi:hypothetical protein